MQSPGRDQSPFMRIVRRAALGFGLALTATLFAAPSARAQSFYLQYSFTGGTDGASSRAGLISDAAGDLYGTTSAGGVANLGTVFVFAPDFFDGGTETRLHSFLGGSDGDTPTAGLVLDATGNLYGTTTFGGAANLGTVFKVDANNAETVLHSFTGGADGAVPHGSLVLDGAGKLYGTTGAGGVSNNGTVFKLDTNGTETVLYSFTGGADGGGPVGGLILDAAGNLYGTTADGGVPGGCIFSIGCGVVFELDSSGTETVLHTFTGMPDGAYPNAGLILDSAGNLYGTTAEGGTSDAGTVFQLDLANTETVLYSFGSGNTGSDPVADLVLDATGNLYGTTSGGASGFGTVFQLTPAGTQTALYTFTGGTDGASPQAGLNLDAIGNLYGTTNAGGAANFGTVFAIAPDFSVTASALTPGQVRAGGSSTSTVSLIGISAFNQSVTLSCSVMPSLASAPACSISPGSVVLGVPATLTVTTTGTTASGSPFRSSAPFYALLLPLIGIVAGAGFGSERKKKTVWFACLLFAGLGFGVACGGGSTNAGGGSGGTPAGTYTITVTGSSAPLHILQHSTVVILTVQ